MKHPNLKSITVLLASLYGTAHAAGFALIEQNASGLGNAYAGQAAVAEDASTIFFNPAGMTRLAGNELVVAAHLIRPSAEFSGSGGIGGGTGGDIGDLVLVPNAYFAYQLSPSIRLGLGMNSPFGLKTEYDVTWLGRLQAINSELKTVNINPSIAWKASESLSLGAGVSIQYAEATLTNATAAALPPPVGEVKGDDYGWGFNLGALWNLGDSTRLGITYRSEIDYTLKGDLKVNGAVITDPVFADTTLPDSASLSLFHRLALRWEVLMDVTWTGWSDFDDLRIVRANGTTVSYTPENWDDSYRYSVGANYHMDDKLTLRVGIAFDETPVPDAFRTPRIPDQDRTWIAVGGKYRLSRQGAVDFGYAHLFVKDANLSSPAAGTIPLTPLATGSYEASVDILSFQYTHTF
jgi:long-chain fatty acid transport protein